MKCCVITFPGSNCDHDTTNTLTQAGFIVNNIWHQTAKLPPETDLVIIPGGFSYGDYLRCGAIAATAPVIHAIRTFANQGGLVAGICNGFQILTEAKMLPGTLLPNAGLLFRCHDVFLKTETNNTPFTNSLTKNQIIRIPIAHHDGNFFANTNTIKELEDNNQILFRYCTENGTTTTKANPNGSINNIAGITNKQGNVMGMMPHPERCTDKILGNTDGQFMLQSVINKIKNG